MRPSLTHTILVACVLLLITGNVYLLAENRQFRTLNRSLILQNDSLQSVGIELNKKLKGDTSNRKTP